MTVSRQTLALACGVIYLLFFLAPTFSSSIPAIGIGLLMVFFAILHLSQIITATGLRLNFIERLTLAVPIFLLGVPLTLYLIYSATGLLNPALPVLITGTIFIISLLLDIRAYKIEMAQGYTAKLDLQVLLTTAIFTLIISVLVFWYKPLPDLDPYGWIQTLEPQLQNGILPFPTERPLFASLVYTLTTLLGVDMFTFFKYVFPYLPLLLCLPLWLLVQDAPRFIYKLLFSLYLLAVPSTALYLITPTPQAVFIILSVYVMAFILYSKASSKSIYFFAAGIVLFFSFFYHQIAAILFILWCAVALIAYRKTIFSQWHYPAVGLAFIIALHDQLSVIGDFVYYWIRAVYFKFLSTNALNVHYPAQYINIDGYQMGWPGFLGVAKFYAYYASPIVLGVLVASTVAFLITKQRWRTILGKETATIVLIFLAFFSIAEILPRIPNIALLPERAWVFASIFSLPFFMFLIQLPKTRMMERVFITAVSLCLVAGIVGTVYVNSLKRFLITPDQIASAQWIQQNLPDDKIIYGYNNNNLIIFHAKSPYVNFQENILCANISLPDLSKHLDPASKQKQELSQFKHQAIQLHNAINNFTAAVMIADDADIPRLSSNKELLTANRLINQLLLTASRAEDEDPLAEAKGIPHSNQIPEQIIAETTTKYIYFAAAHERNPYNERGYNPEHWGGAPCGSDGFLFDKYPETFTRVYDKNEIVIWQQL